MAENVAEIELSKKRCFLGHRREHTLGADAAKLEGLAHNRGNVRRSGVDSKNSSNLGKIVRIVAILCKNVRIVAILCNIACVVGH